MSSLLPHMCQYMHNVVLLQTIRSVIACRGTMHNHWIPRWYQDHKSYPHIMRVVRRCFGAILHQNKMKHLHISWHKANIWRGTILLSMHLISSKTNAW